MSAETTAPGWWARNWKILLVWLLSWAAAIGIGALTGNKIQGPPPPVIVHVPVEVPVAAEPTPDQGWVLDPAAVEQVAAELPVRAMADTDAGRATDLPDDVYLWKAYEKLFGRPPPMKSQGRIGSCVGHGNNTAVERTLANEIVARKGRPEEFTRFSEEATYGISRVDIGKGRLGIDRTGGNNPHAGSVGAWAAKGSKEVGLLPRRKYPSDDLTEYSEARCLRWGNEGVPAELKPEVQKFQVKSYVQVRTWEEAKASLASGYAISVCSNQGFAAQRDQNGVAQAAGNWGHCMCLDGYHVDRQSGREYGHIENSWGTTYSHGPVGWGNPNPSGFWADSQVVASMLRAGDSWAMSGVTGFPRRKLNWIIARPAPRPFALNPLGDRPCFASLSSLAF